MTTGWGRNDGGSVRDPSGGTADELARIERRFARDLLFATTDTIDEAVVTVGRELTAVLDLEAVGEFTDAGPAACAHRDGVGDGVLGPVREAVAALGPVDGPSCLAAGGRSVLVVPTAPAPSVGKMVAVLGPDRPVPPGLVRALDPFATLAGHARSRLAAEDRLDRRLCLEDVRSRTALALARARSGHEQVVFTEALDILVDGFDLSAAALLAVTPDEALVPLAAVRADGRDTGLPAVVRIPTLQGRTADLAGRGCFFLEGTCVDLESLGVPLLGEIDAHLVVGPIGGGERLDGLLVLVDGRRRRWTDEELAAIDEICLVLGQVRERVAAESTIREAVVTEELVATVTRSFIHASVDDHDEVLRRAIERIREHFGVTSAAVWTLDPDSGVIVCLVEAAVDGRRRVAGISAFGAHHPLAARVLGAERALEFTMADVGALTGDDHGHPDARVLVAPSSDTDDTVLVTLFDLEGRDWGARAAPALEAVAGALGQFRRRIAAEAEIRRRLEHDEVLRRAAARLLQSGIDDAAEALGEVLGEVLVALGADYGSVWRLTPVQEGLDIVRLAEIRPGGVPEVTPVTAQLPADRVWERLGSEAGPAVWSPDDVPPELAAVARCLPTAPRRLFALADAADAEGRMVVLASRPSSSAVSGADTALLRAFLRLVVQHDARTLAERWFSAAFLSAPVAISLRDERSLLITCNPAYEELVGRRLDELVGTPLELVRDTAAPPEQSYERHVAGEADRAEISYRRPDGTVVWGRLRSTRIEIPGRRGVVMLTHIEDVTESRRSRALLEYQASHDDLTGLANRRSFVAEVEAALAEGRRCAVLVLDIDRFKVVNDSLGHSVGDELLVRCADRVRLSLRPGDRVCRLGGDEFAILLVAPVDETSAAAVADRLLALLRDPVQIGETEVFPSASVGIAFAEPGDEVEDLLRHADVAMYQAKARGRDRWETFDRTLREAVVERVRTEADLRRAIDNGQLEVHYQPEFLLATGEIVGAEALVRWRHPERGLLAAGSFIELAEETGLVVDLGRWVLETATRQARAWRDAGRDLIVRVNLSARQLRPAVVDEVAQALEVSGLEPEHLCLELTETAIMDDVAESERLLTALRELGVHIAVDDFGTGFSSLAYLKRFPVDILKIDRTFVDGVGVDPDDTAIVRSVIGLARTLKLEVVAEGIEDASQVTELVRLGCGRGQGFHLARPAPADQIELLFDGAVR